MPAERKRPTKPKRRKSPKRAAAELAIERRRVRATNFRLSGWSIRDIAAHLKCSVGTVHSDLSEVLVRTQDASADATKKERALSLARLDIATKGIWDRVESGDDDAVDRLVKLEARRAKLLGTDAPTKSEHSGPEGGPIPVEAQTSLARKLDDLAKRLAQLSLAERLALDPVARSQFLSALSNDEARVLEFDWSFWARPKQLAPAWDWYAWLILAGRGFGKTRVGAEWIIKRARLGHAAVHMALVAETASDARDVLVEGESGILAYSPPWFRPKYEPSKARRKSQLQAPRKSQLQFPVLQDV